MINQDEEEDDDEIKVILVGETATGKTSLINTSIGLEFKDNLNQLNQVVLCKKN